MSKYEVKANVNNITRLKDGSFSYNQEIVWMKWDEKAKKDAVQSGKGPGEFGPDYSDRKQYHLDYHADWENPTHDTMGRPLRSPYPSHVIDAYMEPIKRSRTTPLTKEEIEYRHEQLKKDHEGYEYESDRNTGRTHKD